MDLKPLQSSLRKHLKDAWIVPVLAILASVAVVLTLALVKTPEYSSEMKILVVQKYTLTDSYTASKSAEKISRNLAEVVGTSTFLDRVVKTQDVDLDHLMSLAEAEKRKVWKNTLQPEIVSNTSMLKLTAYHEDPAQAEAIVKGVGQVLIDDGADYHGASDTIALRVVDTALTSTHPTRPNLLLNGLAAALFGTMAGLIIVFLRPSIGFNVKKAKPGSPENPEPDPSDSDYEKIIDADTEEAGDMIGSTTEAEMAYAVLDVTNYDNQLTASAIEHPQYLDEAPQVQTLPSPDLNYNK